MTQIYLIIYLSNNLFIYLLIIIIIIIIIIITNGETFPAAFVTHFHLLQVPKPFYALD